MGWREGSNIDKNKNNNKEIETAIENEQSRQANGGKWRRMEETLKRRWVVGSDFASKK